MILLLRGLKKKMSQDTNVNNLIINKLTKEQYESIENPSDTELYLITDDNGIDSSDVINALGYTPYNSSNPNGYTSNVGTVTSVNNVLPDNNGNVTVNIPDVSNFVTNSSLATTLEGYAETSDIPTAISDLTDDTSTNPIDKTKSVKDQRDSSSLKYWTGTKAQYDAIVTKDNDTIYNVEDTTSPIVDILNTLYPIGAIYIGTMATCPLSVLGVGTWQLVAQDRVLQGAGTRGTVGSEIDESLPNYEAVFVNHWIDYSGNKALTPVSGAIGVSSNTYPKSQYVAIGSQSSGDYYYDQTLKISPSISNQTYQDNAPVQQDGYLVNIWERIS